MDECVFYLFVGIFAAFLSFFNIKTVIRFVESSLDSIFIRDEVGDEDDEDDWNIGNQISQRIITSSLHTCKDKSASAFCTSCFEPRRPSVLRRATYPVPLRVNM